MSKIHISTDGEPPAQYDEAQVPSMLQQGLVRRDSLYWKEGMPDWEPLSKLFPPAPPPPPIPAAPASPPAPPAAVSPYAPPAFHPVPAPAAQPQSGRYAFTKDPRGLTTVLKVMLGISALTAVITILGDLGQWSMLSNPEVTQEAAEANDIRQALIGLLYLIVYIATTIVFGMWIHRANRNCRGFGAAGMEFTPGWAVGWYFIPIANLFKPFQAMKEIWQVSSNPRRWQTEPGSALLGWWWALWLIGNVLGQIVFRVSSGAEGVDELKTATVISLISSVEDLLLIGVAMMMISRIVAMQLRLTEQQPA